MQIETPTDRLAFFETKDFADDCLLTGPAGYRKTFPVILNAITDPVVIYDTNIEAPARNFICRLDDVADVDRRVTKQMRAEILGIQYQIERLVEDQDGNIVVAYLKK